MNQQQYPMQPMANQMAQHGRYGDSMMVHMNPIEVQGIAALSPTGQLTRNPVTGQPEAFLPFLAPLLGSMFGKAVLAKSIPFLAGKTALASAIGSGLATTAATGDIKKGLLSGITGFGLGKALGAASDALNPQIAETATALGDATTTATGAGVDLAKAAADAADPLARSVQGITDPLTGETINQAFSPVGVTDSLTGASMNPLLSQQQIAAAGPMNALSSARESYAGALGNVGTTQANLDALRDSQTIGQDLSAPFRQPGAFAKELIKPMNLAAVGVGEGQSAALDAERANEERNRAYEREEEAKRQRALANIDDAYNQLERDYSGYEIPRGAAAGGIVSLDPQRYQDTVNNVYRLAGETPVQNYRNGGPSQYMSEVLSNLETSVFQPIQRAGSSARQSGIRGSDVISPEELQGYRPGFDPEISYFKTPPKPETTETEEVSLSTVDPNAFAGETGLGMEDYVNPLGGLQLSGMEDFGFNPAAMYGESVTGVDPKEYNQLTSDLEDRRGKGMFGRQGLMQTKKIQGMNDQIAESLSEQPTADLFAQEDGSLRPMSSNPMLEDYISMANTPAPSEKAPSYTKPGGLTRGPENIQANKGAMPSDFVLPDSITKQFKFNPFRGIGAAGFDEGGITSLTQENLNPRMPVEKAFVEDDFVEMDRGAMADTMEANGQALIDKTVMAIAGRLPEDESQMVINEFIEQFGPEAFTQLRDRVLTEIVPNAQTEGEIMGAGGGMDDMIQGMIGDQQRVAVSPGEYIVPADVVSGLGDGSTDAGVGELDQMLDRVREERTGMTRQPPKLASAGGVLPA